MLLNIIMFWQSISPIAMLVVQFSAALKGNTVPCCCFHGVLLLSHIDPVSWSLAFVPEWFQWRVSVCPLFLAKDSGDLVAFMFRAANLKTIGKAGTGW